MLLKFAIKEFLDDREFKNLSPVTIVGYKSFLEIFLEYCTRNEIIDIDEITASTVKGFLLEAKNVKGNNPVTINTKLKNLKAFFNYLEYEEIITEKNNPAKRIPYGKTEIKIEVFTDNQIAQMLNYYRRLKYRDKSFYSYRDYMIIVFLLGTGVRVGELVNLRWKDADLENCILTVFGKKREYSSIPISEKLKKELREYKIFCEKEFNNNLEYVFTDKDNKQMTDNAVKNMFKRLKVIMNFKDVRLSAHTFRHTFANRCLLNGMDVFTLQKMLRHKNLSMTERYLALWGTALRDQNEKFNPLNDLNI